MILQDQVKVFSYFGLLPFILVPIVAWISPDAAYDNNLIEVFYFWSTLMLAFMMGTLWGFALKKNQSIFSAVALFALLFMGIFFFYLGSRDVIFYLIILLILYEIQYIFEKNLIKEVVWYKNLRFHLTFSIRICHLLMIAFIFTNQ